MNTSHRLISSVAVAAVVVLGTAACDDGDSGTASEPESSEATAADTGTRTGALRDERYCEVIPITREATTLTLWVYNTQGHNDCPTERWDALTPEAVNAAYGSQSAELNGPRHWTLDSIEASGSSTTGETFDFGGIEMELRATIESDLADGMPGGEAYVPNEIQRDTIYTFDAGKPIFELTSPEGDVYVMQSYSLVTDPTLTIEALETLQDRLELPEGWTYSTRVLDEDLLLDSGGLAYLVQDDLGNSYQRRT